MFVYDFSTNIYARNLVWGEEKKKSAPQKNTEKIGEKMKIANKKT